MNLKEKIAHYSDQIDSISETILSQMKAGASNWENLTEYKAMKEG